MRKTLVGILVVCMMLSSSIVYAKKQPDWIMGQSKKYPTPRYFIGVGSYKIDKGSEKQTMGMASDKARAEISKIIKTEIQSEMKETRAVEASKLNKKGSYKTDSKQFEYVLAKSNEILEGVEIKEFYKDKKQGIVYALAVLDRIKTSELLENRVTKMQKDILADIEQGKSAQSNSQYLSAIKYYDGAFLLAQKITAVSELAFIINPLSTKNDLGEYYYEAEIKLALFKLKKLIKPCIKVDGEAKMVENYIKSGLTNAGFSVVESESTSCNYLISGNTNVIYKGQINMGSKDLVMQIYESSADLSAIEKLSNEVVKSDSWRVNANDKTKEMARMSSIRALGELLNKQIANKLLGI